MINSNVPCSPGRYECAKMLVEVGNANLHLRDVDTFRSAVDWIRYMVKIKTFPIYIFPEY